MCQMSSLHKVGGVPAVRREVTSCMACSFDSASASSADSLAQRSCSSASVAGAASRYFLASSSSRYLHRNLRGTDKTC